MSATGLEIFDKTTQTTNVWLDEIMADHGQDRQFAWHLLGVVLRTVRDRLPVDMASHLGAQLPLLVRGTYYEQFEPSRLPQKSRSLEEFLGPVEQGMNDRRPVDPKAAVQSVFKVLFHHIDPGQIRKVRASLPEDVRQLCPDPDTKH
ncbi:DUF2267 domain-containing protein [Mesorhizobium sp. B2-1-3]|uniref:DUF2267 domain-containing protein n=1 Tax=Mesorhizobium sp. B2-1-3 TaxID=2589972 RepID=UPI0011291656|nr:DUF2267 domain-containing protein [Mesorhizobium sp. B2-1-3]TPN12190.1 DUF2267 domain-containing protein [Mesorhizobium sp. B2-1-3]